MGIFAPAVTIGADHVARAIFNDSFRADAILTFPGPSSIFAGLVLSSALGVAAVRTPVYTAVCAPSDSDLDKAGFRSIPTASTYTVYLPELLTKSSTTHQIQLAIVDDVISTGEAMAALRKHFASRSGYLIRFACCICYEGCFQLPHVPPEVFKFKEMSPKVRMPWGLNSASFEDALR
jgi:adenine/guanine phosphoribosyltransferase-like PRPP-binding protein